MNSAWDEVSNAMAQAREAKRAIENHASNMIALLLEIDLTNVNGYRLAALKKKLRRFNAVTKAWEP